MNGGSAGIGLETARRARTDRADVILTEPFAHSRPVDGFDRYRGCVFFWRSWSIAAARFLTWFEEEGVSFAGCPPFVSAEPSGVGSETGQLSQRSSQIHFLVSGLETVSGRCLNAGLGFWNAHALTEEIGLAMEVFGWRERDGVDSVLDRDLTCSWEPRDPMSERLDELIERGSGQRPD